MKRLLVFTLIASVACTTTPPAQRPAVAVVAEPGTIQGTITDSSRTGIPGATVTAAGSRGGARTAVTDSAGRYVINGIAPGLYDVTAELAGFGTTRQRVTVRASGVAAVDLSINPAVTETITVTAEAPPIGTRSSTAGFIVSGSRPMPKSVGRSFAPVPAATLPPPATGIIARPQFARFEDRGFTETANERVTTFAIDVDRASYANVRGFLENGVTPPADAVRIEEMINYFTYDYPQPEGEHPFSITAEVAGCPWNGSNRLLRIGIQGRNLEQWKMAPNNLVFLIDVSGSMDVPASLPLVKQAFRVLVEQLRAEDRVAIVVYAGASGLVLPSTSGADKQRILEAIDNLRADGSTAGAAGIELAYQVAIGNFLPNGNNRVILATDGDFNVGTSSIDELQKLIEKKRESGVFLSTVGVGFGNYQDALMETLADKGNGNYNYLDSLKEAEKVFKHELTGTLVTIAKDVKVQLDFDPSMVASYRQIGYENRALANADFTDDTKDAGELGAGHSVTALYEIVPRRTRGTIATIRLRYKEPDGAKSREAASQAVDEGKSAFEASPDMQFAAAVAEMGMLLRNSPHKGSASWDDIAQLARMARGVDLDGTRGEFGALVETMKVRSAEVARK
jgi:Ca-activated chloride channel homolog